MPKKAKGSGLQKQRPQKSEPQEPPASNIRKSSKSSAKGDSGRKVHVARGGEWG